MRIRTISAAALAAGLLISVFAVAPRKLVAAVVATLIRDQDAVGRHPFVASCSTQQGVVELTCYTAPVPAGEEVVIQNASFQIVGPANSVATFSLTAQTNGTQNAPVAIGVQGINFGNEAFINATQPTAFMADPGSVIACTVGPSFAEFFGQTTTGLLQCTVTGYYVTLP
jgi:hypothetical protein